MRHQNQVINKHLNFVKKIIAKINVIKNLFQENINKDKQTLTACLQNYKNICKIYLIFDYTQNDEITILYNINVFLKVQQSIIYSITVNIYILSK